MDNMELDDTTKQVELALQHTIRGLSRQFVESLCNKYLQSGDGNYSKIYNTLTTIEQLECWLRAVQSAVLQGNVGADTAQKLRVVICILEDLLLNAMEGNDISDLQGHGVLFYQSVDNVY